MNNCMISRSGSARDHTDPQATPCSAYELKRAKMLKGAKMKLSLGMPSWLPYQLSCAAPSVMLNPTSEPKALPVPSAQLPGVNHERDELYPTADA